MVLVSTDFITGQQIETISFVHGLSSAQINERIDFAIADMVEKARKLGADGIVGIRDSYINSMAYVSGTSVRFIKATDLQNHK